MKRLIVFTMTAVWLGLFLPATSVAAEEVFRRWAILATPDIANFGVSDLLAAELSQRKFDLVEREQLAAITKEIELSKLLSPEGSSQRLQIGKLAKADALVLLSLVEHDKKQFVKLIISDCRYGSRLRLDHFPFAADRVDKLAVEIAQAAAETRTKFARGVEQIVAVSPFLSKNLTHEFDHLQFGFAALLGDALSQQSGIAVLEIEEARAIGEELTRATSELQQRRVPLFVEAEFEVLPAEAPAAARVRFAIRALDGRSEREATSQTLDSLAKATSWLTESLPAKLFATTETTNRPQSLTVRQQHDRLVARAEMFSKVAAYSQASALREAALLLAPDDWEQRVFVLGDYSRQLNVRVYGTSSESWLSKVHRDPAFRGQLQAEFRTSLALQMGHAEKLFAANVLNPREALLVFERLWYAMNSVAGHDSLELGLVDPLSDYCWSCFEKIARSDDRIREGAVHPSILAAFGDPGSGGGKNRTATDQYDLWTGKVFEFIIGQMPLRSTVSNAFRFDDRNTIRNLERFIEQTVSPDRLSAAVTMKLIRNGQGMVPYLISSNRIAKAKVIELLVRWRSDSRPLLSYYGRVGLIGLKSAGVIGDPVTQADLAELTEAEKFLAEWGRTHRDQEYLASVTAKQLSMLRGPLTEAMAKGPVRAERRMPLSDLRGQDPYPRLAFEPIEGLTATWTMLTKCREGLDLVWSWESVGIMTEPGQVRVLWKPEFDPQRQKFFDRDTIYSAAWDGEHIWVASSRSGVRILALDGSLVGQLRARSPDANSATDSELPPFEPSVLQSRGFVSFANMTPLWIYPLSAGRCFVAGRFGPDNRRWFGAIERQPADAAKPRSRSRETSVRTLTSSATSDPVWKFSQWHQATQQPPRAPTDSDDNLEVTFTPMFFVDYTEPMTQRRWLMFGRPVVGGIKSPGRKPLAFDVMTGQPTIYPHVVARGLIGSFCVPAVVQRGNIVSPGQLEFTRSFPTETGDMRLETLFQQTPPTLPTEKRSSVASLSPQIRQQLIVDGDWLYGPGPTWRRIDTRTWKVETLTDSLVSARFDFESFSNSAHYGLVAWNQGDALYRVHVDPPREAPRDLAWLYPFLPAEQRERHHRAVTEIRRLGGEVDSVPLIANVQGVRRTKLWRTAVCLTDQWQGGDDGLRLLTDLADVGDLILSRAAITDDGLTTVSELKSLQSLLLMETKATNAGVQLLAGLPELSHLWLEDTPDGDGLNDAALAAFKGHRKLFRLTLSGRGFSDAVLPHLLGVPQLFELRLLNTSITPAAIAEVKRQRAGMRFLSETTQ